jgi:hypothetical protein
VIADNDLPETGTEAAADAKEDEQGNPALFWWYEAGTINHISSSGQGFQIDYRFLR